MKSRLSILFTILLVGATTAAEARTWNVSKDGTGDYAVIQDAVDHAASGDTVLIGPGRYEEKRPYTSYPPSKSSWTFDVYVAVDVANLTLIGSGADQTIIGPPFPIWQGLEEPKIICALSRVASLNVQDLAMENAYDGVYRDQGGSLRMRRCRTKGNDTGIITWSDMGTFVEDCHFQNTHYGVAATSPANLLLINNCTFQDCGATFDHTSNAIVSRCTFNGYTVGCQFADYSTGGIYDCEFNDVRNYPIVVKTWSYAECNNNRLFGGFANLLVKDAARVTGSGNVLSGGINASLNLWTYATVDFHNNTILHGSGPSVLMEYYINPPVRTINLINNYWGTADSTQIAEWIWDGNDDPNIKGVVEYQPFLGSSVRTELKSWGEIKRLYAE